VRSAPAYPEPYIPPALRKPLRDYSSGPILLRYQAMQKLKKRFDDADQDGNGTLTPRRSPQGRAGLRRQELRPHRHRPARQRQLRRPENLPDPAPRRSALALSFTRPAASRAAASG
jgi:hypothetical protein